MEGDKLELYYPMSIFISIHSLRMEGDNPIYAGKIEWNTISIHSLRMEGDTSIWLMETLQ